MRGRMPRHAYAGFQASMLCHRVIALSPARAGGLKATAPHKAMERLSESGLRHVPSLLREKNEEDEEEREEEGEEEEEEEEE